jgi:hypothetical protein
MMSALNILGPVVFWRGFGRDIIESSTDSQGSVSKLSLAAPRCPSLELLYQKRKQPQRNDGLDHLILHTEAQDSIPVYGCIRKGEFDKKRSQLP